MIKLVLAAAGVLPLVSGSAHAAGSKATYETALTGARAAERQAGKNGDQWTATQSALKSARQAAAAKDFAKATALAMRAEALAKLSVAQAQQQETAWRSAVVR